MNIYLRTALAVALGVVPLLLSCGGGGGGSAPVTKAPGIYGTAASGLGHSGGKIDVVDGDGNSDGGQADGNGDFIIPTTIVKTPPYLLRVTTATLPTTTLYSVSADEHSATTINITPLTDLIIRSWYSAQTPSITIEDAFADPVTHPAPKPDSVSLIHNLIKNVVQLWLDKNGVTSNDFNLISTPFTAGTITVPGTGLDKVLDQAWVNAATGQIVISNGTTTQNTTLNAFLSSLTASTTTVSQVTGSTVESGNNDITSVPTTTVELAALAGINTTLANIANTINARGLFLSAADLLPYLDPSLVNDGFNQAQFAQILRMMALSARASGQTVLYTLKVIKSLDTTTNVAEVRLDGIGPAFFRKVSGTWLISGNGRIANIAVSAVMNTRQGINPCPGVCDGTKMTVKVDALQGMISNVTVTGGGFWNSATVPWVSNVAVTGTVINLDRFWLDSNHLASLPAKDTPFQVIVTPVSGPTVTYTIMSNAYTTEPISITNLSGSTIGVANLNNPLTVNWTKPISFPIQGMIFGYQAYAPSRTDPNPLVCTGGVNLSGTAAPSATVTILPTCQGTNVGSVNLDVVVNGVNGESSTITYVIN
jgi:hypothetical protein